MMTAVNPKLNFGITHFSLIAKIKDKQIFERSMIQAMKSVISVLPSSEA